jgi:hypothetical protein
MPASTNVINTIGIDIGKNTFHLIGLDTKGAIVLRQKLSRSQVYARLANIAPCLIGMWRHASGRITWADNSRRLATTRG